jgi:alpha-L-fucosidase 2
MSFLICTAMLLAAAPMPPEIVFDTPGENAWDSMPLGNGDIGINFWTEKETGDAVFYIGKTDAWSENARLLKLARVRLHFAPNPFTEGAAFRQALSTADGCIRLETDALSLRIRVDANHPAIAVDIARHEPVQVEAALEVWRNEKRELKGDEARSAYGMHGGPKPLTVYPDTIVSDVQGRRVWYHRNETSIWQENLEHQGLGELSDRFEDPLLNRTFGGMITGAGFTAAGTQKLVAEPAARPLHLQVLAHTAQTESADAWLDDVERLHGKVNAIAADERWQAHQDWWRDFWNRSWIEVSGSPEAETVSRGYALQRFINAGAGRGNSPIKFNGSIFNVDLAGEIRGVQAGHDADFRDWGGPYWWQNTRLPYWSMIQAGDFSMMQPLFRMYLDAVPLAEYRTQKYYDHGGIFFPETMYFWGTYTSTNYGWDRGDLPLGTTLNQYIRYEWQGGIELIAMMLDYVSMRGDDVFLKAELLPFAEGILRFYDEHYPREADGTLRFEPAQALETYWDSVNPMPEIAGLHYVLDRLLKREALPDKLRAVWEKLRDDLPPLPLREEDGEKLLSPAGQMGPKHNQENPELYAIFPYRLYGVGRDDLDLARRTFAKRQHPETGGWHQNAIQAAMLGLTDEAKRMVVQNFSTKHPGSRFPAFWGPNFDWVPDQDHGAVSMIALQRMLLQHDGDKMLLFPAWPGEWEVNFRLHARRETVVEGVYRNGKLEELKVTPGERREDVTILLPGQN